MRILFSAHAGEYLVGSAIERLSPTLNVWVPSRDRGVDLLVTNERADKAISVQVKMSRDYRPPMASSEFHRCLEAAGWMVINDKKLARSPAHYWVFVLISETRRSVPQYLIAPPQDLRAVLRRIHGARESYHFYPWVTTAGQCIQGRGLRKAECALIPSGKLALGDRDLSRWLNNWGPMKAII